METKIFPEKVNILTREKSSAMMVILNTEVISSFGDGSIITKLRRSTVYLFKIDLLRPVVVEGIIVYMLPDAMFNFYPEEAHRYRISYSNNTSISRQTTGFVSISNIIAAYFPITNFSLIFL